ncbi:MAG: molecular chaperone DnaJ [Acidimicrobiia bacterium]|nr:molecular chaperone DnaJ [Acidimicrobiia bacterium]
MNQDWLEKDFYQILGVSKDASAEEIKRAYRKLAQKLHPDANPGDSTAEERFKQISEAYGVIGNEERRKEYDELRRLGASGFSGFGGAGNPFGAGGTRIRVEDLGDLFGSGGLEDLFGGFGGGARSGTRRGAARRGADHTASLHMSFDDAFHGVTTTVSVRGEAACSRCGGSGAEPGTSVTTCPTCNGAGQVAQSQGMFAFPQTCPQCRGAGRLIDQPCGICRGRGTETRTREIRVKIPAGVKDGATIKLPGKGGPGRNGGPPGDLLVNVTVEPHPLFGRKGNDLTITVPITFSEAALGTKIDVPTMDGEVTLKIPAGTTSGKTFRVRGRGVPSGRSKPGDLLVKTEIAVPSKPGRDLKKLLEQLGTYDPEDLRAHLRG